MSELKRIACLLVFLLAACGDPEQRLSDGENPAPDGREGLQITGSGGTNSAWAKDRPYLILLSIDGFRWDYLEQYPAPAIEQLASTGVRATALIPVFPTLTFPNHYSLATGLYPANHGIVANNFPGSDRNDWYAYKDRSTVQDGRWYGGEPIWVAAEKHDMVSAAYFFVGTEAPVGGIAPTHWFGFDREMPGERRVDQVLAWLAEPPDTRPHMIALYFEEVDEASHRYGPGTAESIRAIANVDRHVGRLTAGIHALAIGDQVTVVIVSDHGQSSYRQDVAPLILDEVVELDDFAVVDGGSYAFLFALQDDSARLSEVRDAINQSWENGRAMLREELPDSFHAGGDSRFPEIVVLADPHFGVIGSADRHYIMTRGDHGWSPEFPDMHGIFIAAGPRLPQGEIIDPLSVVDVYPLLREILELPQIDVDGDASVLLPLLREPLLREP